MLPSEEAFEKDQGQHMKERERKTDKLWLVITHHITDSRRHTETFDSTFSRIRKKYGYLHSIVSLSG